MKDNKIFTQLFLALLFQVTNEIWAEKHTLKTPSLSGLSHNHDKHLRYLGKKHVYEGCRILWGCVDWGTTKCPLKSSILIIVEARQQKQ